MKVDNQAFYNKYSNQITAILIYLLILMAIILVNILINQMVNYARDQYYGSLQKRFNHVQDEYLRARDDYDDYKNKFILRRLFTPFEGFRRETELKTYEMQMELLQHELGENSFSDFFWKLILFILRIGYYLTLYGVILFGMYVVLRVYSTIKTVRPVRLKYRGGYPSYEVSNDGNLSLEKLRKLCNFDHLYIAKDADYFGDGEEIKRTPFQIYSLGFLVRRVCSSKLFFDKIPANQALNFYIHSVEEFIIVQLKEDDAIICNLDCLVGMTEGIKFKTLMDFSLQSFLMKKHFFQVIKGPGLVIFKSKKPMQRISKEHFTFSYTRMIFLPINSLLGLHVIDSCWDIYGGTIDANNYVRFTNTDCVEIVLQNPSGKSITSWDYFIQTMQLIFYP